MCGIFGTIALKGFFNKDDFNIFVKLTNLVSYRGPDDCGYKALNTKEPFVNEEHKFKVFLGHRRLSIIDLSEAGHQPFTDGNGLWIIYNGEIFNYIELRENLKKKGYIFKTETDTEVILKVYKEYGENGFSQLNGMWAFAVVDIPNERVVLSRDRFSIKPLYFYQFDDRFYFSSEIKQILPILKYKDINSSVLYLYLKQGLIDTNNETFFKNIYKFKPMHNVVVNLKTRQIEESKYWEYSEISIPDKEDQILEQIRELFIDSVKIRLRSDVPVGCLLSGGLDSSSIAVIAEQLLTNGIDCYSAVSGGNKYSEEEFVDIVRDQRNIKVNKLFLNNEASWNSLEKAIYHSDEPIGGFSVVAQYQILEQIKENSNIKVVLSGQGGDEIFCGYRKLFFFYLKEELKHGHLQNVLKTIVFSLIYRTVLWQFSLSDAKRYMKMFQKKSFDPLANVLAYQSKLDPIWKMNNLKGRQILDIDKYSVPQLAHYEDRNSMAHSLEIRLPFLDHRLVNYVLNIPNSMKVKNGWPKYALRKAIKELPKSIAWRRDKQAFLTPEEKWIKHDFREEITNLFSTSKLHDFGLIHKNELLQCFKSVINGNKLISYWDISRFLMAELWIRKFLC